MPGKDTIEMLVEGGKASPDPNSAQKLSAYKLNIGEVFKKVNDETAEYAGMEVPVKIIIDKDTKEIEVEVGMPPTSSLLKKEMGLEKAAYPEVEEGQEVDLENRQPIANLSMEQVVKVAKVKRKQMLVKNLKDAVKQVVGTVVSMQGIQIEEKSPKEIMDEIKEGKWNHLFSE